MPATFADVYDLYRNNPSFAKLSLRDFAKLGNLVSGGQEFDAATGGAFDQTAKKASYWLDQGIDLTGLPDATGYVGRAVYDIFGGDPARGEAMGRSLPREALNFLPMVFAPTAGAGLVAGMAGSGALGALNAWEKTDDALSAATGAVAPFVGHAAARVGGSLMARHVTPRFAQAIPQLQKFGFGQGVTRVAGEADKPIEQLILSRMGDKVMASVGEQAGATIGMEGLNAATGGWRSWAEDPYNTALDAIFSGLAFAPVELAGLRGNKVYERALKPTVALPVKAAEAPSVEAEITRDFLPTSPERVELARKEAEYLNERDTGVKALNMSEEERISRLGQINDKYGFAVDGVKGAGPEKDKVNGVDAQAIIQAAKQSFHDDPLIKAALEAKKSDLVANEEMLTQDAIDAAGLREKYRQAIEAKDDVALWGIRKDAMQHRKTRLETPLELPIQKKPDDILNPQVATDELAKANVVRDELELPIVDDVEIEARISDEVEAGESVDDAAKTVVASVVNETSESVKTRRARGRPKGSGKKTTPALEALGSSQAPIDKKALEGLAQLQKAKGYITAMQLDSAVKLWQDARADSNLTLGKAGPKIAELDEAGQLNALMKYVGAIPNRENMPKANPADYVKDASGKRQKFKDETSALAKANELSQSLHADTRWTVRKQGTFYYVAKVPKGDVSLDTGIDVSDVVTELPPATEKVQDVDHKRASRVIDDAVVERILALGDDDQIISLFEANPNVTGALIEEQLERLRATTPMILLPNRAKREAFKEVARIVRERDVAGIKKLAKLAASERVDTSRDSFFSGKDAGGGELNGLSGNIGNLHKLSAYDKERNSIGKYTLPSDAKVSVKLLNSMALEGKTIHDGDIELYRKLVPDAFEGELVDVAKLSEGLLAFSSGNSKSATSSLRESVREVTNFDSLISSILRRQGMTDDAIEAVKPAFTKIKDWLSIDDATLGELVEHNFKTGQDFLGFATNRGARRAMILGVGDGITKMKPADQARALSFVLAHEAGGHLVEHLYNQKMLDQKGMKAFDEFNTWTQKATPAERAETLDLLAESFLTKEMRDNATISQMLKTSDPEEARATMLGMWSLATATGGSKNADLGLLLAPREVRNVWSTMARYARKVWSSIKGAMFGDSEWRTKASKLRVDELVKSFETIRKSADRASKMVQDFEMFTGLDAHSYKNLRGNVGAIADDGSAVPSVRKLAADLDLREGAPGPIKRVFDDFVQPLEQLAETVPQVREATYALLKAPMQLKQSIVKAMAPLLGDWNAVKAEFSKGIEAKEYKRVVNPNNKASEVFSQIKLKEQELQSSIDWNSLPAEIQAEMNKLTPSDQTAVRNVYERHKASVSELQKDVVRKYDEIGVNVLASYLTSRDSTLFKDAHKAAYLLKAAYKAGLDGDETTRAYHLAQVMDFVPQENTRLQAMAIAQEQVASIRELEEFFAKRPWFASLTRHGKFFVKAKDAQGKDISNQAFYDEGSYNKWKAEKQAQGATEFVRSKIERGVRANIDDTLGEAVKKVESRLMSVIDDSGLSDDNKANMKESLDLVGELRRYQAARQKSFGPERTRRIAEGADELNLLSTHHKYVDLVARKMSNGVMKSRWAFESSNPELVFKYAPELERIKTGIEHYMQPDSQFARAITKLNAVNFLGFNFVNALQEGFQSLFTHVHQLRADGMKYGEAAKLLAGTAGNIINFYSAGKGDLKNWKDPNERAMLLDSAEKGLIGYGAWTEIDENRHIENVLNARYLAKNGWQEKLPDWGRKGIRAYADMSLALFKVTSMFNAKMALLSAYRHARKTMGHYEATEYAQRFSTNVNQAGGRAGRPIGQGSMGAFGPVVYALNRYNLGVTAMMSRFLRHGFQGEAFGKTPRQRADARAAATGMIGMQLAAAGALGLPFMGPATALFEKLSGVDIKGSIYEFFGETLDEDSKDGGILADIVMNGAANALGERVGLPLDFSSRYAIGGVPGVSQLEGVSADSIFGATGALVKQIATGVHKYLAEEDIVGGTKAVMPPGLRKAFDLWANGDATSTSGKHLGLEEGMEKWLYAGGFTPSRIRKLQQFDRLNRRNEEIRRSKDVRTVSQVVDLFQTDPALARARLGQLMKEGNVDARKIALGVADSVVEKAFGPEDFRKSSTRFGAKEALALARGMGLPTEMGNEVARMQLKMKVMRTLGLSFRPNIARAQQYDQQSVTDPFAPFVPQA